MRLADSNRCQRDIAFPAIAESALCLSQSIVQRWLPDGKRHGFEWIARNPKRNDHRPGSFRINLTTGRWSDFATGDSGGDLISLAAYLFDLNQAQAALRLAGMLGVEPYGQ